ncbi:hypothetical protein DPQ22_03305 [Candidatus Tokpelaia sp.]|nr:hypothetical protein DPQ22_03305 [Candidatus Tokpelaia sp.]
MRYWHLLPGKALLHCAADLVAFARFIPCSVACCFILLIAFLSGSLSILRQSCKIWLKFGADNSSLFADRQCYQFFS